MTDAYILAGQQKNNAEYAEIAEVWAEDIFGVIPIIQLRASLKKASDVHETNFPVNSYELKAAYRELEAEAKAIAAKNAARQLRAYNSPFFEPCRMCFGSGTTATTRRIEGVDYKGVVKCYSCSYWEIYKQKHGL